MSPSSPPGSPGPFLALQGISKRFGGVQALDGVSLEMNAGEVHCLAGENGSGKSTLIKLMAGVHRPQSGTIRIGGQPVPHLTPVESVARGIQVIYQDLSLFPNLTVAENLALNSLIERRARLVSRGVMRDTAARALASLGITIPLDTLVADLPIAQKQLIAIARALHRDARLVILDEPTTALTHVEVDALFALVRQLQTKGVAMLFVSHKVREMLQISDRFTVLRNGRVVEAGLAREFDDARVTMAMTGRSVGGGRYRPPHRGAAQALLEVSGLTGPTIRGVGLRVEAGEIVGLTGLLGAGQRDVGLALAGLERKTVGDIRVGGVSRRIRSVRDAMRAGIAYVPADRLSEGLFLDQSVATNTNASSLRRLRSRWGLLSRTRARTQVTQWMRDFRVRLPSPSVAARTLSGGNQQRVVLAKWLATRPSVLVLNGPTVGVDVGSKEEIHQTIRRLAADGMGVVMISDDLPELAETCNRVLIMNRGAVADEVAGDDLTHDRLLARLSAQA